MSKFDPIKQYETYVNEIAKELWREVVLDEIEDRVFQIDTYNIYLVTIPRYIKKKFNIQNSGITRAYIWQTKDGKKHIKRIMSGEVINSYNESELISDFLKRLLDN